MTQPLSLAFNAAVMTLANRLHPCGYDVSDLGDAPDCLEGLNKCIKVRGRLIVSGENSEHTIFADPGHNYAFRAWHDWCHWHLQAPFDGETTDYPGERAVCALQKEHLHKLGYGTKFDVLIDAEIIGQIEYAHRFGGFPVDQYAFTLGYLIGRDAPLFSAQNATVPWHEDFQRGFELGYEA